MTSLLIKPGAFILAFLAWIPLAITADSSSGSSNSSQAKAVDRGVQLYLEGRYQEAIAGLQEAVLAKDLDENRRIGALQYLAFSQTAVGDLDAARQTFRSLLELTPEHILPAGTSPKIVSLFDEIKAEVRARAPKPLIVVKPEPVPIPPALAEPPPPPPARVEPRSASSWWIWTLVGAVIVGAGVAVAVSLPDDREPSGRAIVTIQVGP